MENEMRGEGMRANGKSDRFTSHFIAQHPQHKVGPPDGIEAIKFAKQSLVKGF